MLKVLLYIVGIPLVIGVAGMILLGGNLAEGFCWMMVIVVLSSPLLGIVGCVCWGGCWLYKRIEIVDTPEKPAARPRGSALRPTGGAAQVALVQYIEDALRDGQEEAAVGEALVRKGWAQEQIEGAFRSYRGTLDKYRRQPA